MATAAIATIDGTTVGRRFASQLLATSTTAELTISFSIWRYVPRIVSKICRSVSIASSVIRWEALMAE